MAVQNFFRELAAKRYNTEKQKAQRAVDFGRSAFSVAKNVAKGANNLVNPYTQKAKQANFQRSKLPTLSKPQARQELKNVIKNYDINKAGTQYQRNFPIVEAVKQRSIKPMLSPQNAGKNFLAAISDPTNAYGAGVSKAIQKPLGNVLNKAMQSGVPQKAFNTLIDKGLPKVTAQSTQKARGQLGTDVLKDKVYSGLQKRALEIEQQVPRNPQEFAQREKARQFYDGLIESVQKGKEPIADLQKTYQDLITTGHIDEIKNVSTKYKPLSEALNGKVPKNLPIQKETPKTIRVWKKSRFSDGGGYDDIPVIRKEENITLYQGGKDGDGRQFWTPNKKYAEQFGNVKEKTGSFYQVDNGNRMTNVYVEAQGKENFAGAVAGFQQDENGNITYDPKAGLLGVAGVTAGRSKAGQKVAGQMEDIIKNRGFIETIQNSPKVAKEIAEKVQGTYPVRKNVDTIGKATQDIAQDFERALSEAKTSDLLSTDLQARSVVLVDQLQKLGRFDDAVELVEKMAERATSGGQATQILAAFNRLTPEGILTYAGRQIQKAKTANPAKYGGLKLNPQDAQRLHGMAKQIQGMSGEQKMQATRKMIEEVDRLVPTPFSRKMTTLWKAGLLTGIKGAVGGNVVGNSTNALMRKLSDVPAAAIDTVLGTMTGNRSKTFTLKGLFSGAGEGLHEGFKNFKQGVNNSGIATKLDYNKTYYDKDFLGKIAQKYTDTVFNFYAAADRPFYYSALRNILGDMGTAEAMNKGLRGNQAKTFVQNFMKNPPEEVLVDAVSSAQDAVFQSQNPIGSMLSKGKNALKAGYQGSDMLKKGRGSGTGEVVSEFVAPFTGVPSSVATALYNYSPAGGAVEAYYAIKSLSKGGLTKQGQRALSEALGKSMTGLGAMWLGKKFYEDGILTLGYPNSERDRNQWELEGKIPYAIKIGDTWKSLNYTGPLMSLLSLGGEVVKASQDTTQSLGENIVSGIAGSGKAIIASSPLQGVQSFLNVLTDPSRYGDSYINNAASSVIPTLVKDVALANDTLERQAETLPEALQSKIPYLRNQLDPKYNAFGQPEERNMGPVGTMIDPFRSSKVTNENHPLVNELRRLMDEDVSATPLKPDGKITIDGENYELPRDVLNKYKQYVGQRSFEEIAYTMQDQNYMMMNDEEKSNALQSAVTAVKKEANKFLMESGLIPQSMEEKAKSFLKSGDIDGYSEFVKQNPDINTIGDFKRLMKESQKDMLPAEYTIIQKEIQKVKDKASNYPFVR